MADAESTPTRSRRGNTRATKAQTVERVNALIPLILGGLRPAEIVRFATAPAENNKGLGWDLNERQIERYIAKATAAIEETAVVDRLRMLRRCIARMEFLYGRLVRAGDLRGATQVQREVHAMYGFVSARPEFNQHISVNAVSQAAAAAASIHAPLERDSFARKILDIKRRQTITADDPELRALPPNTTTEQTA